MADAEGKQAMTCLSAIRKGRAWFDLQMAEHVRRHLPGKDPEPKPRSRVRSTMSVVRSENAYHVAEFFDIARELGLLRRDRLPALIARHNADMHELLASPERGWHMGLSPQRIPKMIFSPRQEKKIFEGQPDEPEALIELDKSDFGKLLSPLMPSQTWWEILEHMEMVGLLKTKARDNVRISVSSPGILEDYFHEHLMIIDAAMCGEE